MATKKATEVAPVEEVAEATPVDLTRSELSDGTTVEWYKREELTPRRMRAMTVLQTSLMPKFKRAYKSAGLPDDAEIELFDIGLDETDTERVLELQERAVVTFLKSWSRAEPLPETTDALLDLPITIYDELIGHAARIQAADMVDQFSVDSVENPDSPTGDSGN